MLPSVVPKMTVSPATAGEDSTEPNASTAIEKAHFRRRGREKGLEQPLLGDRRKGWRFVFLKGAKFRKVWSRNAEDLYQQLVASRKAFAVIAAEVLRESSWMRSPRLRSGQAGSQNRRQRCCGEAFAKADGLKRTWADRWLLKCGATCCAPYEREEIYLASTRQVSPDRRSFATSPGPRLERTSFNCS